MTRLADALDDTIEKLETLVDSQKPAPENAVSSLQKLSSLLDYENLKKQL